MTITVNLQKLNHELDEPLAWLRASGFQGVECWPSNAEGGHDEESWHRYEEKDVARCSAAVQGAGLEAVCVTLGFFALPLALGRGGIAAMQEALVGTVDAAVRMGALFVNCYLAGVPARLFVPAAQAAADHAAQQGVCIVLENEAHDDSATPEGVRAICAQVGSSAFGTVFDPCNYLQAGCEAYPAAYDTLREHIRYVHLKGGSLYREGVADLHRGGALRHRDGFIGYGLLSESSYHPEAVLRRLRHDGYDGPVCLEPHVPNEHLRTVLTADIAWLREHLPA